MNVQEFDRADRVFDAVLDVPPQEREAYLKEACGGDEELQHRVERLLRAAARATASLVVVPDVSERIRLPARDREFSEEPGTKIGSYILRDRIGEGGFAIVYAAEQTEPVRRQVALKIIKLGMDTRQVMARFEAERQALAMMDHPNVAKVFDAGATETGRPYFVMEYVAGIPITEYCDQRRLSIAERLRLFTQVCEAVQHSHQKAIIHRDIKPSNVLVTDKEGEPLVKVIDFGVAKAINHRLTERTIYTEQGQLIGTPEYMSPEQAEMTAQDIDTRSDIYSLGVLLYELLTGSLPFDPTTLRQAGLGEIQRIIREDEPPKPSTRLSSLGDETTVSAERRRADPRSLLRDLRGDLDWITMKAMEKDRSRRYETANGLAMDIQRHLTHQPILARPPSAPYQMRKFIRRHRLGVAAGVAIGATFVVGLTVSVIGFAQAVRQRHLAVDARDESEAVTEFLAEMLSSASPWEQGQDVSVRQVLDVAAEELDDKFADQPAILARLHQTIGDAYTDLAVWDQAESHLKAAMDGYRTLYGDHHLSTGEVFSYLGKLYWMWGRPEESERWMAKGHDVFVAEVGPDDGRTLEIINGLAMARHTIGRSDEAEGLLRGVLEKELDPEGETRLTAMNNLAVVLNKQERYAEARETIEQVIEIRRRVLGDDHPDTVIAINVLATTLQRAGKLAEATLLFEESLAVKRQHLASDHQSTLSSINNLAFVYLAQERFEEALPLYEEVLEAIKRSMAPGFYGKGVALTNYAKCLLHFKQFEDAETALLEAHEILEGAFGPNHPGVYKAISLIVEVFEASNRPQLAAEWRAKLPTEQEAVAKDPP